MHHILITGTLHPLALERFAREDDVRVSYHPDLPQAKILPLLHDVHALVTRSETAIDAKMLEQAPRLRVIARAAVGFGNIDVEAATQKGILVINTPGKNTNSAAELTLGLLLAIMRRVLPADASMRQGQWNRHRFSGRELAGKTLGIIGLGNVGRRVAHFGRAFDMLLLAHDPYIADEVFETHHARKCTLAELLAQADVVTVHVPLNAGTRDLISHPQFSLMKAGVVLLNAARGGLVNEQALLEHLNNGQVAAAGIDTWAFEPPKENPFQGMAQVVMTPHIGASTLEAQKRVAESIAEQTLRALREEVVDNPVNMPKLKVLTNPLVKSYTVLAERLGGFAAQSLDFNPNHVEALYRGELSMEEGLLVRRAFLKGFLHGTASQTITYVNAEQVAQQRGFTISDSDEPGFSEYPHAVKFVVSRGEARFAVGGVVFGQENYRLSTVNEFVFEVIPEGNLLYIVNEDRPGVIGDIGSLLGLQRVNISQFELSRNMPGGKAMSLIRTDTPIAEDLLEQLRTIPNIVQVRRIIL